MIAKQREREREKEKVEMESGFLFQLKRETGNEGNYLEITILY